MTQITEEYLAAAERLMGVEYTPAERAQMLDNLEGQIELARLRRHSVFPNDLPTALRFDPRPPGFSMPTDHGLHGITRDPGPLPDDPADVAFAPLPRLAGWLRGGVLRSRRLTEIYLERIERLAPRLECFVTVTAERALREAEEADAALAQGRWLGPLHGVPYGAKDLLDTAGIPTTWGAMPYRERVADREAHVVARLREAGAVLIGKTTLGALAYGDIWFGGRTRNPWNTEEGSSGSSAGSAAAVAAGLCGFAIGTETMGSITSPSQRCGSTGLRPTFGRVGRSGAMALCWSLDKIGPMCRGVEDCALVLQALNGPDPGDRSSIDAAFGFDASATPRGMRVGYFPYVFEDEAATEVDRAALEAVRRLDVELVEVALPDLPYDALMPILFAEAAAAFEDLTLSGRDDELVWQDKAAWPNTFRKARFLSAVDHVQSDRLRYRVMLALDALFHEVDAVIGPLRIGPMMVASNFTGHPCLHLRAGFVDSPVRANPSIADARMTLGEGPDHGRLFRVPHGISLWGRLFDEGRLCTLGMALEADLGVHAERPPL
ncbi:amidase [Roseitranquillus sediminis]|uniref:amidase n=1 Tax=Roseitranquillus sediminis TaxID=2809051 RepID=UPI001D0BFD36|nr:amidase [Roseitranquillus sediminis]MBM9594186.1 amidase [Roseitranquillus sediminis]